VFVTSGWVAKEGEKLIDNLFLGRILGAGMQVRGVQGLRGGWGWRKLHAGAALCNSTPRSVPAQVRVSCTAMRVLDLILLCANVKSQLIPDLVGTTFGQPCLRSPGSAGCASRYGGPRPHPVLDCTAHVSMSSVVCCVSMGSSSMVSRTPDVQDCGMHAER